MFVECFQRNFLRTFLAKSGSWVSSYKWKKVMLCPLYTFDASVISINRFKVTYYSADNDDGIERMVGVGQILLLAPRHPSKGVRTKERVSWKIALRDIDVDLEVGQWGTGPTLKAEEVDRLTFCCCECCHGSPCRSASQWCCGSFPGHSNANQFFTPSLFSAYHREGYRACMDAKAAEFLST